MNPEHAREIRLRERKWCIELLENQGHKLPAEFLRLAPVEGLGQVEELMAPLKPVERKRCG